MEIWHLLCAVERDQLWAFVRSELRFRPYNCNTIIEPRGYHRVIDLSHRTGGLCSVEKEALLAQKLLEVLTALTPAGEEAYALEYEDDCYRFSPQVVATEGGNSSWPFTPCPISGYVFYITADRQQAYCADGIAQRIYLIGTEMVRLFGAYDF